MMRTEALRALRGWTGIPYDDEVATFAALSEVSDGYHDPGADLALPASSAADTPHSGCHVAQCRGPPDCPATRIRGTGNRAPLQPRTG